MKAFNNILIIQTAFIGDAILASSLAEKLHHQFPETNISILVRKGNESVYADHPFLKEVLVWDKQKNKLKNLFGLLSKIRSRRYDCVVNCHRYSSSGFLAGFSGASHISGYKENPFSFLFNYTARHKIGDGRHEVERYQELIADFSEGTAAKPKLYPSEKDFKAIVPFQNGDYVCIAPASVWYTKQLPAEKWIEICNTFSKTTTIYLIGSPDDVALGERIRQSSTHSSIHNLSGKLSLLQSAALMKSAMMNYVNDSAPLHLTSSVNAPVTAFFLSTIPEFGFGPLSDVSKIVSVEKLDCRPCGLHGYKACPLEHFKCGNLIKL